MSIDFPAAIAEHIRQWLGAKQGRSLHNLANRSMVSYSVVQRAAGEQDVGIDKALRILEVVADKNDVKATLSLMYPRIFEAVEAEEAINDSPLAGEKMLSDPLTNKIFALIGAGPTKLADLQRQFGEFGLSIVEKLLAAELVAKGDDMVYIEKERFFHSPTGTITNIIMRANEFNPDHLGRYGVYAAMITQQVDFDTAREIGQEVRKFLIKITKMMSDKSGTYPIYVSTIGNVLDDSVITEEAK